MVTYWRSRAAWAQAQVQYQGQAQPQCRPPRHPAGREYAATVDSAAALLEHASPTLTNLFATKQPHFEARIATYTLLKNKLL